MSSLDSILFIHSAAAISSYITPSHLAHPHQHFTIFGSSSWPPRLALAITLMQVNLGLICSQALSSQGTFRYSIANCILDILFCRLLNVESLLNVSLLQTVVTDTRAILISLTGVCGFFLIMVRILQSSTVEVFIGLPGPLQLLSSPVPSFSLMVFHFICVCLLFSLHVKTVF